MNTKRNVSKRRISIIVLLTNIMLLTACAGQQAAQELAGLEISTMLEYKQAINKSISKENEYYQRALNNINESLKTMNDDVNSVSTLNSQAKYYDHLSHKSAPSQYNILELINAVYANYEKTN